MDKSLKVEFYTIMVDGTLLGEKADGVFEKHFHGVFPTLAHRFSKVPVNLASVSVCPT